MSKRRTRSGKSIQAQSKRAKSVSFGNIKAYQLQQFMKGQDLDLTQRKVDNISIIKAAGFTAIEVTDWLKATDPPRSEEDDHDEVKSCDNGHPMGEDFVFCPLCPPPVECSNCNVVAVEGAIRCHRCGTSLKDAPTEEQRGISSSPTNSPLSATTSEDLLSAADAARYTGVVASTDDTEFLNFFERSTVIAMLDGEHRKCELWRFQKKVIERVDGIRRGIHVDVTAGISHKAFIKKVPIGSSLSLHVALNNCLRLRAIVAPSRTADSEKLRGQVFDFMAKGWNFTTCVQYIEKVRAKVARKNQHCWGAFDAEVFAGLLVSKPSPRSSSSPRPASNKPERLPQDAFDNLRAKGFCLPFNKGGCPHPSPHTSRERRNQRSVTHACALCDGPHSFQVCPQA